MNRRHRRLAIRLDLGTWGGRGFLGLLLLQAAVIAYSLVEVWLVQVPPGHAELASIVTLLRAIASLLAVVAVAIWQTRLASRLQLQHALQRPGLIDPVRQVMTAAQRQTVSHVLTGNQFADARQVSCRQGQNGIFEVWVYPGYDQEPARLAGTIGLDGTYRTT